MVLLKTPNAQIGWKAKDFELLGVDEHKYTLNSIKGPRGFVIVFMCNHCPYVQAVIDKMVLEASALKAIGVGFVGINSNDTEEHKEDSYPNMQIFAKKRYLSFPYLVDPTQTIAKIYGAVCTPDFFGFNKDLELQYRGRLDSARMEKDPSAVRELFIAMNEIAETGKCSAEQQHPSMGCSIKWRK